MPRRPRLIDIAREAGLSVATVDRNMNGRGIVRPETVARIAAAMDRLGYVPGRFAGALANASPPGVRFGILLHKSGQEFYQTFAHELQIACKSLSTEASLVVEFARSQAPSEVSRALRNFEGRVDVLAATAVNHPSVTAAVSELKQRGLPVFALLSDFAAGVREGYVGLDNLKVGKIAGWIVATAVRDAGKVAVFVGGHRWHGHDLRESGFRTYLAEAAPQLDLLDTVVNLETRQLTRDVTRSLLAREPDLRALYVAGGGMEGALAALAEKRRPGEVVVVVNELTAESRRALAEGWVILVDGTPLPRLCRDLLDLMQRTMTRSGPIPDLHFLPPDLHVAAGL